MYIRNNGKMENESDNDFFGGTGDDDDDTAPPPLGARSHNVLQQLDDEVLSLEHEAPSVEGGAPGLCRPRHDGRWVMMHRLLAHLWS